MDIEQEAAISEAGATTTGAGGSMEGFDKLQAGLTALLMTVITAFLGWAYKTRKSGQSLEDTTNEVTVETIISLRARNTELENQIKQMMIESSDNFRRMLKAEESSSRATVEADIANAAAVRARAAAEDAQEQVAQYRTRLNNLIEWMKSKGIELPPNY